MTCVLTALIPLAATFPLTPLGDEEARSLLKKAIEARGGAKLEKVEACRIQLRASANTNGQTTMMTGSVIARGVDYLRTEMHVGNSFSVTVLNQNRGWVREGNNTRDMTLDEVTEERKSAFRSWTNMVLATADPAVTVERLTDKKDGKQVLLGLRISKKGDADLDLWVDGQTYLPVLQRFQFSRPDGEVVTMESRITENKKIDGIVVATKSTTYRNGIRWLETEVTEVLFFTDGKSLDFSKP